ncbi:MAG: hypothetical protein Q9162_002168 [Coniocarpon cinnabarinum]
MSQAMSGTTNKEAEPRTQASALQDDFIRQQATKQEQGNFHSSSLRSSAPTMVSGSSVNRTSLYPSGVQPQAEHTELEEELHEKSHIDYDRVAIIANPSVAALYEDALVYESGSAITSSGALSAYSGAKTGRSPSDKRIVKEEHSSQDVWWGPVNKPMDPAVRALSLPPQLHAPAHPRVSAFTAHEDRTDRTRAQGARHSQLRRADRYPRQSQSQEKRRQEGAPWPSESCIVSRVSLTPHLAESPVSPTLSRDEPAQILPGDSSGPGLLGSAHYPSVSDHRVWRINRERAVDYLNTRNRIYVVDGFAGWDERYRINVRVICARAYHALFMRNMLIRPSRQELEGFHPDYIIYNAGAFPANRFTTGMTSATSVAINFSEKEMVILGTEYAGEMKKGIFTVLFYEMPVKHNVLTLHSSANIGQTNDVTVFFGLSGTGKTTLSADPKRALIGDDEHCWSDRGVFNIEGGCYAKCIGLSAEKEPDIFNAIKFGSILENVVFDPVTRVVDYDDSTLTENTRCAYPIEYIENTKIPCITDNHPTNIVLLTCDARGVLPPISKLDSSQTMFHFISGYTSKMAGTEDGVTEPQATFSSCFAQPFLALHPMRYAKMLADKITHHNANAWLLNTGWVGAGATTGGKRCPLKYTRAILDAIHSGELAKAEFETYETFNLSVPKTCTNVPDELLNPKKSWTGSADFKEEVTKLGSLFMDNFKK